MKTSPFRIWCRNLWIANADERNEMVFDRITLEEYFKRYKFWLKREYKHQIKMSK